MSERLQWTTTVPVVNQTIKRLVAEVGRLRADLTEAQRERDAYAKVLAKLTHDFIPYVAHGAHDDQCECLLPKREIVHKTPAVILAALSAGAPARQEETVMAELPSWDEAVADFEKAYRRLLAAGLAVVYRMLDEANAARIAAASSGRTADTEGRQE